MDIFEDLLEGGRRHGRKHGRDDRRDDGWRRGDRGGPGHRDEGLASLLGVGPGHGDAHDDGCYGRGGHRGHGDLAQLRPLLEKALSNKALLAALAFGALLLLGLALWLASLLLGEVSRRGVKGLLQQGQPALQRLWEGQQGQAGK